MITKDLIFKGLGNDAIFADGHGLYPAAYYEERGFPVTDWGLVRTYESDGTGKGTIFVDGQPVKELCAVYNLTFLEYLTRQVGLPPSSALGRGFAAQEYVSMLTRWVNS